MLLKRLGADPALVAEGRTASDAAALYRKALDAAVPGEPSADLAAASKALSTSFQTLGGKVLNTQTTVQMELKEVPLRRG